MKKDYKEVLIKEEIEGMEQDFIDRLDKEKNAVELNDCLMSSYGLVCIHEGDEAFEGKIVLESEDYPDYYGGSYIDEAGSYVILIAGSLDVGKKALDDVLPNKNYEIRRVKNSYKIMMETLKKMDSIFDKDNKVMENVAGYFIAVKENRIIVELFDFTDKAIEVFKKNIINCDMIDFEQGRVQIGESNVVARPGRTLTWRRPAPFDNESCSIGFRARRNGIEGFVTTAHGPMAMVSGRTFRVGNIDRGTATLSSLSGGIRVRNARVDASFCVPTGPITLSQRIHQNQDLVLSSTSRSSNPVGISIRQAGRKTNITSGVVRAIGVTEYVTIPGQGTVRMTNLIRASYHSDNTDSGGIVYYISRNASGAVVQRQILGIHVGADPLVSNRPIYCSIFDIQNELGARPF
jgi:streptogrisin B